MKKIFTLAAVAAVAASASAMHTADLKKVELTPEASHKAAKNLALIEAARLTDIEGEIVGKHSYTQGNIEYDSYFIKTGTVEDQIQYNDGSHPDFEESPLYIIENAIIGYNRTTGNRVTLLATMLAWPSQYYAQMMTWTGPWVEEPWVDKNGETHISYNIPLEDRDFTIVPIEEMLPGTPMWAQFKATGYVDPLTLEGETADPHQTAAYYNWPLLPLYGGLTYNGKNCKIDWGEWSFDNQSGPCSTMDINEYEVEDGGVENMQFAVNFILYDPDTEADMGNFKLTYDGSAFTQGFSAKNYTFDLQDLHIFNAGVLDEDNNNFYGMDEDYETLQMYYFMTCDDNLAIGSNQDGLDELAKDPSFENAFLSDTRLIKFWLNGDNEDASGDAAYYAYGYLFSKPLDVDAATIEPQKWNLKLPTEYEYTFQGQTKKILDYMEAEPDMFVPAGVYSAIEPNRVKSAWSQAYGTAGIFRGYDAIPEVEGSVIALGSTDGFVLSYKDEYNNSYFANYMGNCYYHPQYENVLNKVAMATEGTLEVDPMNVKAVLGDFSGVKVAARNGMISVTSMENAPVAVYTINGQLLKAASVSANNTINVPAAKGAYIVKVGKTVRKVVL